MRIFKAVLLVLLVLLNLAAGIPKILQMPQELEFLAHLGLSPIAVSILGVIQFSGGGLLVLSKTRVVGAASGLIALVVSAIALFIAGSAGMGLLTLLPAAIAAFFVFDEFTKGSDPADRGAA
ncbi:hypothetical protein [Pseudomarimonas salicorniae]|uniref:DoxX-like family protein n=1 Tax=Pseudomarimonas salicorniae TaxID=2933270 RepID=A0ABT0GLN4_9GAMM|nr:hypothetical protein [Lysobacter sp. CAU 1642]MCK7595462.1 hypothetical protein [Lysobacter sp. CAU 1642]